MFDIGHILKRAWGILWNYRVLWVFALLLALSGGARGGSGGGGGGGSFNLPATGSNFFENGGEGWLQPGGETAQWFNELEQWADSHILPLFATEETAIRSVIAIVAILMGVSLLIGLLLALVRARRETAVLRALIVRRNGPPRKTKLPPRIAVRTLHGLHLLSHILTRRYADNQARSPGPAGWRAARGGLQ